MPDTRPFHNMLTATLSDAPKPNYPLDLRLFAMVNNDAWLTNSSLEGGQMADAASLLSAIIADMQTDKSDTDTHIQTLQEMLKQIHVNAMAIQDVTTRGDEKQHHFPRPGTPESRESLIQTLAATFAKQISSLTPGASFLMPGGFFAHAMLFEFKRVDDNLVLMIYNTGGGSKYHDSTTVIDNGVVKTKHFPILAYELPFNNVTDLAFTSYLAELLKTKIASKWTPLPTERIPIAYPRDATDLYQKILPLVVHLKGKPIDPLSVCKQRKLITGQRSGKCSEAVFHPLLREVFADETVYQRFMLAYRKATIAGFMAKADLNDPLVTRHLKLAVANLAARTYKHSDILTVDELKAITAFTQEVLSKIPMPASPLPTESPILPTLVPSRLSLCKDLEPQQKSINISLAATSAKPTPNYEPLQPCKLDTAAVNTLQALFENMNKLQDWITQASTRPEISPKEIVVAIEQLFFTYPIHLLHQPCDDEQRKTLATFIQTFMSIYLKHYLQQLGVDATAKDQSLLTARHVVTVYSALALMTTAEDNKSMLTSAMQALFVKLVSEAIEKNAYNPYLTSMSYACDQRLAALSTLKPTFTADSPSPLIGKDTHAIYAAVITASPEQKRILLEIFRTQIMPNKQKFKLNDTEVSFLNEDNQCLFVLLNAYSQLSPQDQLRLSASRETAKQLMHYHQIFNLCGSMTSRSTGIPKNMITSFNLPDLMQQTQLQSQSLSNGGVSWFLTNHAVPYTNNTISQDLKTAQKPIQNQKISDYLMFDMNHRKSDHTDKWHRDPFASSTIQANSEPALTEQEFIFNQFCHTRTADSCQVTATLEFFQANPDLLKDPDWQTVATLNLFQPQILLQAFERNPALQGDCELFWSKLLDMNTNNGRPNPVGLFCLRLQSRINAYLVNSQPPMNQKATLSLHKVYTNLEEMLQQPLDTSLQREIYQIQCHAIVPLLLQKPSPTQQRALLKSYLTAKLLGSTLNVLHLKTNPDEFILQEEDMVAMKSLLVEHADWVQEILLTLLQDKLKLPCKQDAPAPQLQYPSLFVTLADGIMAAINVETGQILKNGKEYCLLPPNLLATSTFQSLVGDSVNMGWVAMEKGIAVPTLFEIVDPSLFIKNTENGFIFQKDLAMRDGTVKRCQLTPLSELKTLETILPKTLCDTQHRLWRTVDSPKQVIIEDSFTKTMLYHIGKSATGAADCITALHDQDYQLLSQADVKSCNISAILGNFEDPQLISVETYTGSDPNKPPLLISLSRYGMRFKVTATSPLTIESLTEPKGVLILDTDKQQPVGIKNKLLIRTEKKVVALLPRQYFIDRTPPNHQPSEYTPLCLDSNSKHQDYVLREEKTNQTIYCNQSEWVAVQAIPQDADNHYSLHPEDGASALYLAYTYLANSDPYTALEILKNCEQQGGLKGTQRELEHLMLFFNGMPAQVSRNELVSNKMICNPEFIAVRTFALYLYADRQRQDPLPDIDVTSAKQDAQCFLKDTSSFQTSLMTTLDETLTQYFTGKHNVPVSMQLNAQQEATCLRMGHRQSLLDLTYKNIQAKAFITPNISQPPSEDEPRSPLVTIKDGGKYEITKQVKLAKLSTSSPEIDKSKILRLIEASTFYNDRASSFKDENDFKKIFTTQEAIKAASDQLNLGLHPDNFFKQFMTYYYIASAPSTQYPDEKEKLERFLTEKMHILALEGSVPGAEFLVALYVILNDKKVRTDSLYFLKNNNASQYVASYTLDKSALYTVISELVKNTTLELKIEDARTPNITTQPLNQLLTSQPSPLVTKPASDFATLTYPVDKDILKILGLPTLDELVTQVGEEPLTKQVHDFKTLVTEHEVLKKQKKSIEASRLSTIPFVDAAAETLQAERELGEQHHVHIQTEIEQATSLFSSPVHCWQLHECVARAAISAQEKTDRLRLNMLDFVSNCTLPTLDNPVNLGRTAKFKPDINEALLISLYLEGSPQRFQEVTGLNEAQTQTMYEYIAEYLFVSTYHKQLVRIDSAFDDLNAIPPDAKLEKGLALRSLALQWTTPNCVNLSTAPSALTVFQFAAGTLLRPEQVVYLQKQLKKTNGQFDNNLCQLIMGFGKTFLLPILAKAKANGDNLSVIEVPEALFSTNLANFTSASLKIFNQKPHSFCFDRHTNCKSQALANLYDSLQNIKNSRDYLVTTGESVASLNLRYIELAKQLADWEKTAAGATADKPDATLIELKKQVYWLGELVKLFRYKADAIVDEVHASLSIRKKLIYSVGAEPIAQDEMNGVLRLYEFILPIKTYADLTVQDIIHNPEQVPQNQWQKIIDILTTQLLTHEASPIQAICKKMSEEQRVLLQKYLQNNISAEEQEQLFGVLLMTEQDVLALYKTELTTLLPATLSKQNRRHYGLLLKDAQIMRAPCAVPFIASDTPNIINKDKDLDKDLVQTTHFANPDETLNYTIQAYLVQGLPKDRVKQLITSLREKSKIEFMSDNAENYATTATGKTFLQLTQAVCMRAGKDKQWTLDNPKLEDDDAFVDALMHEQPFIFYALQHEILPTIMVENATLEIDSTQKPHMYHSYQGIAGTIDNHHSISQQLHLDGTQAIGTNGVTIGLIDKKATVHVFDPNNQPLVETLFSKDSEKTPIHAIIDAGGRFTGVTNLKIAEAIAAQLRAKDKMMTKTDKIPSKKVLRSLLADSDSDSDSDTDETDPRTFVLFLNSRNELSAIHKNKPDDVIFIGASDEKTIISKLGQQYKAGNWVTYFDQRHTVGMDITQTSHATAAITVAYDGTLSAFLQAAMRMRGLPKEQTLQIFMDKTVANYCTTNNAVPTPEQIITFLSNNERAYLSDENLRYVLAEMDNTLYQELLEYLLPPNKDKQRTASEQAKMLSTIQTQGQIFMKTTVLGLHARYGHVEKQVPLLALLNQKKQQLITLRKHILSDLNIEDATPEKFEDTLKTLITLAQQTCKPTVYSKNLREEGNQVEAETAVNVNAQMETETALAIENVIADANQEPNDYQEWLSQALQHRGDIPAWKKSYQEHCLSLPAMLQTTTVYPPQLRLHPKLWISKNHAKIFKEQVSLFDQSKMPFKYALMRWQAGALSTFVITPHEAQALIQNQAALFSTQEGMPDGEHLWIESIPSGRLAAGQLPPAVKTDLTYLAVKEQLLLMNGDLKSLLHQKHYVWLPGRLAIIKRVLPQILISRPDQRRYVKPLLTRISDMLLQYEKTALEILADPETKLDDRAAYMFGIAEMRPLLRKPSPEAQEKQQVAACMLITRFSASDLITASSLSRIYPQLTTEQASQLAHLYALKNLLWRRMSSTPAAQAQYKPQLDILRQPLQNTSVELLRQVIIQATAEADESLINACYYPQVHTTALLDGLALNESHPILLSLQQHNYQLCTTLLQNHFKNTAPVADYHPPWLEAAFRLVHEQKDMVAFNMLLKNCGPTLALSKPLANDCIALFAQFNQPTLSDILLTKMAGTPDISELKTLDETCRTLTNTMMTMVDRSDLRILPISSLQNTQYLMNYPNFTLQTGKHRGYSQLMLACHLGNLPIIQQLLPNTTPDNRAEETDYKQINALSAAMEVKSSEENISDIFKLEIESVTYLIKQRSSDFYRRGSLKNTQRLISSLNTRMIDDETLSQFVSDLTQYCPADILKSPTLTTHLWSLFSRLTMAKKTNAAATLYYYYQSNQLAFDRPSCIKLMISCINKNQNDSLEFLLDKFATLLMDTVESKEADKYARQPSKQVPFIEGYDNPIIRRACLSALQSCEPKPILSSEICTQISEKIMRSLETPDADQYAINIKDALELISIFKDEQLNTTLLSHISFSYKPVSLDLLQLLTAHCKLTNEYAPMLQRFLAYVTSSLKAPWAKDWQASPSRLTDICCSLIPTDVASKREVLTYHSDRPSNYNYGSEITSSLLSCVQYFKQVPAAIERMLPLIEDNLTNVPVNTYEKQRSNLLLHTLVEGPQVFCDALIHKGARLSDKIGSTESSALDVLTTVQNFRYNPVVKLDKMVELLNLENPDSFNYQDYLKQAIAHTNLYMVEALLRCRHATDKREQAREAILAQSSNLNQVDILTLACQLGFIDSVSIPEKMLNLAYDYSVSPRLAKLIAHLPIIKPEYWVHVLQSSEDSISDATFSAFVKGTDWEKALTQEPASEPDSDFISKLFSLSSVRFQACWELIQPEKNPEHLYACLMNVLTKNQPRVYKNLNTAWVSLQPYLSHEQQHALFTQAITCEQYTHGSMEENDINFITSLGDVTEAAAIELIFHAKNYALITHLFAISPPDIHQTLYAKLIEPLAQAPVKDKVSQSNLVPFIRFCLQSTTDPMTSVIFNALTHTLVSGQQEAFKQALHEIHAELTDNLTQIKKRINPEYPEPPLSGYHSAFFEGKIATLTSQLEYLNTQACLKVFLVEGLPTVEETVTNLSIFSVDAKHDDKTKQTPAPSAAPDPKKNSGPEC